MSAYTTKNITREEAEKMVLDCRNKGKNKNELQMLSNKELDDELHYYVYSEEYNDIVGFLYNYNILD